MVKIDENQEVIAQIRMAVDNYDNTQRLEEFEDTADEELPGSNVSFLSGIGGSHWKLGAPDHATTSKLLQNDMFKTKTSRFFQNFDSKLKSFLREHVSDDFIDINTSLKVCLSTIDFN
jgi:hypothetical protein